jgi:hypothetical protein
MFVGTSASRMSSITMRNSWRITDVSVLAADGQVLFQAPFLAVNRAHIVWVLPEQKRARRDPPDGYPDPLQLYPSDLRDLVKFKRYLIETWAVPWKGRNYSLPIAPNS